MATAAARQRRKVRPDDLFFSGMAVVSLLAVLVGFARTYFLAGIFRAPLPNLLVHIHGAAFTLWIVLFVCQIGLVSVRRVALHRRIGLIGFVLAMVMIALGVLTASDRLARHSGAPVKETLEDVRAFYAVPRTFTDREYTLPVLPVGRGSWSSDLIRKAIGTRSFSGPSARRFQFGCSICLLETPQ